jgi:hypothetical protein
MTLTTGSFCSGIAAPETAWSSLGWRAKWFSEIDPFASQILSVRHGHAPNLGDMTKLKGSDLERVDLVCAGTPCQSFSVAGLRGGMADPRGNLSLVFLGLLDQIRPRWVVWENVPGVLSSWSDETGSFTDEDGSGGRRERGWQSNDFDTFTCALGQLGYGWAWRMLTLNSMEFHSAAVASSLSDILETGDVPQRYFLSATACRGILRRAAKRGRELPQALLAALKAAAKVDTQDEDRKMTSTSSPARATRRTA